MYESISRRIVWWLFPILLMSFGGRSAPGQNTDELAPLQKMNVQSQIANYVRIDYVDSIDINRLWDGAIQGMIEALDPHSSYMPPDTYDDFREKIRGNFQGIGITFSVINDTITVIDVIPGGPSEKAGLRTRDRIVRIDRESAVGLDSDEIKNRLRGPADSKVMVDVIRPGIEKSLPFPITRDRVEMNSVSHSYILDEQTGYIAISSFTLLTHLDVQRALAELKMQKMKRLVLDLRGNSGGSLDAAIKVVDCFIKDGVIVSTKGKKGIEEQVWRATGRANYADIPMVVMINHGSASASEIVAGALQDHDRALIVGQTSFGKGLVMNPYILRQADENLGTLMLTIARYYTPSGRLIQRPYNGTREEYIQEGIDDYDPNAEEEDKSDRPVFRTDLNREVYGGGGITPDRVLERNTSLNEFERDIRQTNLLFQFADEYLLRNHDIPRRFNQFLAEYRITGEEIERFYAFVTENGITSGEKTPLYDDIKGLLEKNTITGAQVAAVESSFVANGIDIHETLFTQSRDFIEREIKMELARMIWGSDSRYRIWDTSDIELMGALTYFDEAEELLNQRLAIGKLDP
ncbi:S41 family peptidase [Candidatus Latescibacterota bacterium]